MDLARMVSWRRGRNAAIGAVAAATVVVAGAGVAAGAARHAATSHRGGGFLASWKVGSRSQVPWRRVGRGWVLAEYWPGNSGFPGKSVAAAVTLYLIDPAGGRYVLYRWPATKNPAYLVDWSGDKSRALILSQYTTGVERLEQVVLATGAVGRFRLPTGAQVIGYTRPRGHGVLAWQRVGARPARLARYDLSGRLAKVLVTGADIYADTAVYSSSGRTLAVGGLSGLRLVSNGGGVIRTLPVAGSSKASCVPSRWWNSATVLASCQPASGTGRSRLWLVPVSGGRPMPLTPVRGPHSQDPGDIGAWRLPRGLYLQTVGSNGSARIFRQARHGAATKVRIPRTLINDWIVAASGPRLLVRTTNACYSSASLLWFNPSTGHEQTLIKAPRGRAGVLGVVAYGQRLADVGIGFACFG